MRIKGLVEEDFIQYKKPSMFIATCFCDWKCCAEGGFDKNICQNSPLAASSLIEIPNEDIVTRYINNPITQAIVIGGLEPFKQETELMELIKCFRLKTDDEIIIYTGYYPNELEFQIKLLSALYRNIIIKFGRYKPNCEGRYDELLGVTLASNNQFAVKIS